LKEQFNDGELTILLMKIVQFDVFAQNLFAKLAGQMNEVKRYVWLWRLG